MRNEDELVERLMRNFDIRPVILSAYTLDEQIALFRNARLIVGPHGAGLANMIFAAPGAVLYELLPDHYINSCINQLAQLRGLHYWCDVHKSEPTPGLWRHQVPWTVDIDAIEHRLDQIISSHHAAPE
jgi:capsular polysaccharide biosynthesis protein